MERGIDIIDRCETNNMPKDIYLHILRQRSEIFTLGMYNNYICLTENSSGYKWIAKRSLWVRII